MPVTARPHRSFLGLATFAAIYLALYAAYMGIPDRWLVEQAYFHAIVGPGAAAIHALVAAEPVQAVGNRLVSGDSTIEIVRGCDGAGVLFLILAAMAAVAAMRRATPRATLWGMLGALAAVWAVNQARVVTLYFAVTRHPAWFVPLHTLVFPTLFVLLGLAYFTLWSAGSVGRGSPPAA